MSSDEKIPNRRTHTKSTPNKIVLILLICSLFFEICQVGMFTLYDLIPLSFSFPSVTRRVARKREDPWLKEDACLKEDPWLKEEACLKAQTTR